MTQVTKRSSILATNMFFSAISEGSIGFLFLLLILSARVLGDEQFGIFSFAMAYVNVFGFMMHGGFRFVYTRVVSREPDQAERYLSNILSLQFFTSLLGMLIIALTIQFTDKDSATLAVVYVFGIAEMLRFFKYVFRFAFGVVDRYDLEAVTVFIERFGLLVVGLAVLLNGGGVLAFALAFLVTRAVDLLITVLVMDRGVFRPRLGFDLALWPQLLRQGFPFMLNAMAAMLLYRIDSVLLSLIRTDAEVGWYSAAYRLMEGMYLFPKILSATLYPSFARLHETPGKLRDLYRRSIKYALFVAVPLTVVGFVSSDLAVDFIYGAEYVNAIPALQILLIGLSFIFVHEVSVTLLAAIDRQVIAFSISIGAVVANIAMNLYLIPQIGYLGAGMATVLAEIGFCVAVWLFLRRKGYGIPYIGLALKPLAASMLVAALSVWLLPDLLLRLLVAVPLYLLLLLPLQFWDDEEWALIKKIAGRGRAIVWGLPLLRRFRQNQIS